MRKLLLVTTLGMAASLLAACNGDDDNGSPSVPLTTSADALRELGNFENVVVLYSLGAEGAQEAVTPHQPTARVATARGAMRQATAGNLFRPRLAASAQPRAISDCTPAGTVTTDQSKTRAFQFFSVSPTVTYGTASYPSPCVSTSDDGTSTETDTVSGAAEYGTAAADDSGTQYVYAVLCAQTTPFGLKEVNVDDSTHNTTLSLTYSGLGSLEAQSTSSDGGNGQDIKLVLSGGLNVSDGTTTRATQYQLGAAGKPLDIAVTYNGGNGSNVTLGGTYAFTNAAVQGCNGAAVTYTTSSPLITGNSDGTTITGGTLKVSSGDNSATFSFAADGSAGVTFANGTQASLTAEQISQVFGSSLSTDALLHSGGC